MISEQIFAYQPHKISQIDAVIFQELIFSNRALAIFSKDPSRKIHFFEPHSTNSIEKNFSFAFKIGQQKVDLAFEVKPESLIAQRLQEVGGIESVPEEFRVALMTFVSREIMNALESLFQLPVAMWDAAKDREEIGEKKELYFEILGARNICEARVSIALGISLIDRILDIAKKIPMVKSCSLTQEIINAEVFIGNTALSLEDWDSLHPGDLIVIDDFSMLTTGKGNCLIKKSGMIPITLKPDLFKSLITPIEKVPLLLPQAASEKENLPHEEEKKRAFSTTVPISLQLNFSAGLLSLTIGETLQLIKTKTIGKPLQISKPLKIFLQEKIVGTGELVQIADRYAILVRQLY